MSNAVLSLPEFAFKEQIESGTIPLAAMTRFCQHLPIKPDGALAYRLQGGTDAGGCLFLTSDLSARLPLVCQRCAEIFMYPLAVSRRFWLHGGALPNADDDTIGEELEGGKISVIDFLTDELFLSLPPLPLHSSPACKPGG